MCIRRAQFNFWYPLTCFFVFLFQIGFLSSALCPRALKRTDLTWPCFGFLSSLCASALSSQHIFQGTLSLSYIWTSRAWEILLCGSGDGAQALGHAKKELYSSCQLLKRRSRIDAVTQSLGGLKTGSSFSDSLVLLCVSWNHKSVFTPQMNLHRYQLQIPGLLRRDMWEGWPHCAPALQSHPNAG